MASRRWATPLIGAVTVFAAIVASAGTLAPELDELLHTTAPGDEIGVIVNLAARADAKALGDSTGTTHPGTIVAELRANAVAAEAPVRAFMALRGATRVRSLWATGAVAARVPSDAIRTLADLPGVSRVRLDGVITLPDTRFKAAADTGWNLETVGAPDLWARGVDGTGVVVAVVDSGVDAAHHDLAPRWRGGDNSWFDPHGEHASPYDGDGHGTQVAGLVLGGAASGTTIGVAPGARWIAGKTFDDNGQSTFSATHEIFQWLLDPDGDPATDDAPDIVNNSWGFRDLPGECIDEFADDIQLLRAAGIAVVFSAGNGGPSSGSSISPANNPGAFAAGASDELDEVMNASSRGPSSCDNGIFPTVVAPGDGVRTADLTLGGVFPDATADVIGTSFAAPHVAGAMALLLSAHPQATVPELEQALRSGAEDLGPDGPDHSSGYGRLDVVAAETELAELVGGGGNAGVYTDEDAFLSAIAGQSTIVEGFEDDGVWGAARSPDTTPTVISQEVSWSSNHAENDITTGGGPARTGDWGFYSLPHGDQTVTQPMDFITDGFSGAGASSLNAVGGWFVGTSGGQISLILDGDEDNPIELGPIGVLHTFFGVVVDGSFTSFEFRETEGKVEDPKLIFVDDITIGIAGGATNRPPVGTILQPAGDVTTTVGGAVFFEAAASDPDGDPVTVAWDFGDGTASTALTPGDKSYTAAGSYTVTFTATDDRGLADPTPDTRIVTVSTEPGPPPTGVVAGAANLPGAMGSDWHTDLYLHNAAAGAVSVQLRFSPVNGSPGEPSTMTVEPDRTVALEDVVDTLFGVTGSGAIQWSVASGDASALLVSANTHNRVDATRRYGQQIPGVRWSQASPAGASIWVPALAGPYRSNLGFATGPDCTTVRIRGFDRTGLQVAQRVVNLAPLSWVQLNGLFRNVFPDLIADPDGVALADSVHRFEVVGVDGRVVAYTSIIDNETSDGSYMLGQSADGPSELAWLPGAAIVSGANDSRWRSDVILMHIGGGASTTDFGFFASGANPTGPQDTQGLPLAPDESTIEEDILGSLFGYQPPEVGSLLASSAPGAVGPVWMRTYTEEPTTGGATRTYGQAIGPRRLDSMITSHADGRIPGFNHDPTTRSNLILQNTRAASGEYLATTVRIRVLGADGQVLGQQDYALQAGEYLQHNRFVDDYGIAGLETGTVLVTVLDPAGPAETGGVDAMISEVNGNTLDGTNDGRLIRASGPGLP